jgi:hypothetical protein
MSIDDFKPLGIEHKAVFDQFFREDPPQISELTFTNLFIWRHHYRPLWLIKEGCLLIVFRPDAGPLWGLAPVGKGEKGRALDALCEEIGKVSPEVRIRRVGENFVKDHVDHDRYSCLPDRDNSDYVYLLEDLINLSGNKYHRKKNHLNQFMKNYAFEYKPMDIDLVEQVLDMQETWCQMRECVENQDLHAEDFAVREALIGFEALGYQGGAVLVDSHVEAFSLGEALNADTAVIHIEKANPEIRGLYAAINQLFCQKAWSHMTYVNREQDKGMDGLRKAKESYHPHHMVNKYTVIPKNSDLSQRSQSPDNQRTTHNQQEQ